MDSQEAVIEGSEPVEAVEAFGPTEAVEGTGPKGQVEDPSFPVSFLPASL